MPAGTQEKDLAEIDLIRLAAALWRRGWVILLAMLLCGAAAFSCTAFLMTPLYQSSALMYVNNGSISVGDAYVSLADLNASKTLVDSYIVIMKTRLTLNEVIERANLDYTYEELCEMVSADAVNATEIFRITVTGPDPAETERIANTIVDVLPDKFSEIMEGCSARAVDYAVVPDRRSSPCVFKYTAAGLLAGLILSCGIIVLRELFDDQIREDEYLAQAYGLPVLANIPDLLSSRERAGYGGHDAYYGAGKE